MTEPVRPIIPPGTKRPGPRQARIWLVTLGILSALVTLIALTGIAPGPGGAGAAVWGRLPASGVDNPVTAVLLNFRGYDTLLELAVLFAALAGTWSLGPTDPLPPGLPSPTPRSLLGLLGPLLIVTAAYLLWIGSKAPGGAFQAGALLAAGGILFLLSDAPLPIWPAVLRRGLITLGLAGFTGMALGPMLAGFAPFSYPPAHAGALILAVEIGATLSIAAVLVGLFHGGRPSADAP